MSNFIRPWDTNTESQEQEQVTPRRSLIDNLGDAFNAVVANFNDVRGTEKLGDLRQELMNSGALSNEEFDALKNKYIQQSVERQAARDAYQEAQNNLVADDSFLKNLTQMGGTIEGMAAQGIGTAVGAGLGFLSPVAGGTAMGAKVGNAAGAIAGGYLDAKSVALQAQEDVLRNGGTWEQAEEAYNETLKKASLTTLPETIADIAMGNRLVRAGLNSGVARKIAGSTLGRMGSAVLDPAAKIGTKAALKSGSILVGRGAGILADTALQGSTEAVQEVGQDYIENREVAKAMGREDNEYSLGGFKDYALSDEGLETMKTAGIMGALFGGVGGTLSSGQYLTRGAETNTGIRAHNNTEKMINDGSLKIDKERRQDEEKIISALTGISPTELATWSDADIVAEASILEGQYMGVIGEAEDMSTTRGAADVVRRLTSKEDNTIHREGDVTETSRAFLKGMGVDDGMMNRMFNSPVEKSLMEKARKEEEQAAKQEKTGEKPQTTATLTAETGEQMKKTEGKTAIENIKEEAQQNKAETPTVTETVTEKSTQNNLAKAAQQQEQQGKIDTSDNIVYKDNLMGGWETDPDMVDEDEMFDQHSYYNIHTEKTATIARATDGGFVVKTQVNANTENMPHFNTLKEAENYLFTNKDNVNFQESNGEQTKEGTTEDPNIVPKDGVDASGQNHSGALINSVDDLFNFMQQNPGLLSRGEFIEFVHAKHNLGVNDLSMYLDRKNEGRVYNEQTGQWGYVNAKKMRDEATGRAIIQLYRGGDIVSAVHEIAHVGYENLSDQDKTTFNRYAVKSMGQWIADMLDVNYDDTLRQRLHNLQNDEELRKKIEDSPALRQTVIAFLNAEQNGVDINHLTADQIRAIDERWAWEFSMWYTEGYMRGVEPQNILQRIYQRGVFSLGDQLNMLQRLWEHIHHKDNQDIESLYTDKMNASAERPNTSGQTASPDMRFTSELEMTQMPNVNTGMNFGGEQTIQYNIPTLGESYNDAQEYAGLYNELERRYANRQKNKGLPSADGSVATNKQRPTNSEGTRTTTTGYKERTTVPAKNKKEAEKLVKIIEGKKSGWEKALEKLAYVDPKRFRSVKVESGNDLWNDQQEKNIENISKMNFTTPEIGAKPLPQTNFTMPNLEAKPMNESVTRANGINTGRPLYFNPTSEQTMNKMQTIKKEQQEQKQKQATKNTIEKETPKEQTSQPKQKEQQQIEQEKPTLSTDEIYSHLYFGKNDGKLTYNKETGKITLTHWEFKLDPETLRKKSTKIIDGEITPEQYKELNERYKNDLKKATGAKKENAPQLVEGLSKEDYMYSTYREVKKSDKDREGDLEGTVQLGKEKETLVTDKGNSSEREKSNREQINKEINKGTIYDRMKQEVQNEEKENIKKVVEEEEQKTNKKTTNKPNKITEPKTKQADPLAELHKKYKNITGTPIGEKGYRFKDDEKQFITAFKQNIDRAVGNKEELLKVSKQLDGWFQNNPTERNRMVRKYLSNYLVDAGQIKVDDGVRNQESNKVERAQQILDDAFPNTRFQVAWHGTRHDFNEFTLEHLLSGEGAMAHGWGLYFGIDLQKNKTNYFDRFSRKSRSLKVYVNGQPDMQYEDFFDDVSYSNGYGSFNITKIKSVQDIINILQKEVRAIEKELEMFESESEEFDTDAIEEEQSLRVDLNITQNLLDYTIENKDKIEVKNGKDPNARYYFVEIPDRKYLLREGATFSKQPPFVQNQLVKAFSFALGLDKRDALTVLKTTDKKYYRPKRKNHNQFAEQKERHKNNLYKFLMDVVAERDANADVGAPIYGLNLTDPDTGEIIESFDSPQEMASKVLNRFGIKGISYNGLLDGECAVIFDDKAIDILAKFKQEEGKWTQEKVANFRNRGEERKKAQRKLEKRRQHDDGTRFQLHSEKGLSKADINSPEFKRWFNGSILTNKDGSPKTFYRGFQQHYDPTYDKEEGGVVWIADKRQFAEDFRDTIIEEEPSYNKKTGKFDGKMIKTTMISRGANVEKGDIAEVYANIKNPFDVKEIMRYASDHDQYVYIGKMLKRDVDNGIITEQQRKQVLTDLMYLNKKNKRGEYPSTVHALAHHFTNKKFFNALKKVGYDSIKGVEGDSMTYGVFEKGNVKSIYNQGTFDAKNKDIRFQAASVSRKGMSEQELDNDYKQIFRGVAKDNYELEDKDIDRILNKYFKTTGDKVFNSERDEDANLFLEINDAINNFYWHDNKLQRGLDGRWRYYIDDRKMKVKKGVDKFFDSPQKLDGRSYPINQLIEHDELFKDYPELAKIRIGFEYNKNEQAAGYYDKKQNKITINPNSYMFKMGQNERKFKRILVHELQHVIQQIEGFSKGGDPLQFMGFDEKHEKLFRDLVQTIYENKDYLVDFVKQTYGKQDAKLMEEIVSDPMDIDYLLRSDEDPNISSQIFDYIEKSGVAFDKYESLLGEIEARDASNRLDMSDEQYNSTKPLDTDFRYNRLQDEYGQVIVSGANKKKDNGTRYQESAKQDKSEEREEKEYNKRKERVEKAKEEGTLSDQMKDVYSVSFTKSAQEYAENRTKMEYFDNNEDYWDRTEDKSTGKVTYVRKTPYEHQQKVVTYNGVNDVKRENKKKSKPAQWMEWMKDQLIKYMFNDKHYLAKAARKLGVYDAYRRMIVTEGYALKANTALTQGIKYNGKTTRALNDIIRDVGEPKQKAFLKYCIAHRILDLKDRENPVFQKMKPDEARKYIEEIKASPDAELFERNRKDFVEYNKALLHVLVDGGIMDEKTFQKFCDVDPNFVPLTKVMDDADMGFSSIINAHNLVNLKSPIKKIGTSMLEIANPFLEMQKRTAEYYAIASRNKAGQIFVNEIAGALEKTTEGDVIARGQGMLRRVRVDERNGKLITKPDDKQQIIYVCNNGKHEFYQVADKEIYQALTFMNADQMGTIHKMLDKIAHVPSGLVRETATMVPDFGVRNVIRDGGEAFLTSEHGFLPVIDQIWGMWQVMNNTEWAQMYFNQNGEYGTLNRDRVNSEGIASVDDVIDEKLNPLKNFKEIKQAQMAILKDKQRQFSILTDIKDGNFGDAWEHTRKSRGMAALKLAISPLWAIGKSNKRMNDLFELGTRVGEFKNAKMGFEGTLDRMARGIMNTNLKEAELQKKAQSDVYAAHVAKDITLNFSQHGKLGKELNRYIPFFNASLQGIYKLCNTLETMATGTTISGGKNRRLQQELLFKAALITAMAVGVAAAGDGDEDYEEAPDYEKENFWILPNGLRFPKDQVLGKIIGNTVEKSYAQWKKGKAEPSTILKSILENFSPDRFMFAIFDLAIGGFGNYDTFKQRAIVPEYMADKLGHLQKDISTSNFAVDVSEALWKCGFDISAKKIDWALQKNFSNCAKYATSIYDLGKKTFNPKEFNERIARGYDKNDSTGSIVAGLKDDIPSPISLVSGTFATNRSTFKSISDFYENYKKYKKLSSDEASMSKEDKRMWKRYEQAYKKDMTFRKQLRAIKQDRTLTGKQKREKADKIFKQQIKLAKWAEG